MVRRIGALVVGGFFMVACAENPPTGIAEAPPPSLSQGAQLAPLVGFSGFLFNDAAGNVCRAEVITDGVNDFHRVNPNGKFADHVIEQAADLEVTPSGGPTFFGTGNYLTVGPGFGGPFTLHATGWVTDGAQTKRAVCTLVVNAKGQVTRADVSLH